MIENSFNLFGSIISVSLLAYIFLWLFRDYRTDKIRQDVFKLRDSLFDEALKGNISFESEAYKLMRQIFNGYNRMAHRVTLLQFIFYLKSIDDDCMRVESDFIVKFNDSLRDLNSDQKALIEKYKTKFNALVIYNLITGSPFLMVGAIPVAVVLAVRNLLDGGSPFSRSANRIDALSLANGRNTA